MTTELDLEEGFLNIGWLDHLIPFIYISDKMAITFSERITSVRDGIVLISGQKTHNYIGFRQEHIHDIINEWFKDIKEIE